VTGPDETIGPFQILGPLGRGGMGRVLRALHVETGQSVALKTVSVCREGHIRSIRREIHALARLRHPGVVRILEHGMHRSMPWLAMELVEGATVREHCAGLDLPRSLRIVRRLCETLAHIHGEGIVHGDLKPENIVVRADGTPVLVDFGLAAQFWRELSRETLEAGGAMTGTAAYMAPEQILGEPIDARADLYALGCILYELVAGRPPFVGASAAQVIRAHVRSVPEPVSGRVDGVSADLDALILRLLAKRPRDRPGHADDVGAALAALGGQDEASAPGPKPRAYLYRPGFSGRDEVLRSLEERLSSLHQGQGGLVLIGGESGVGKTRLALELARRAERQAIHVGCGECGASAAAEPFAQARNCGPLEPFRPWLRSVADTCRLQGPDETRRLLGGHVRVLARYEPALDVLTGQEDTPEPEDLPSSAARERLFTAMAETLAAATRAGEPGAAPLLLLLDDLQWADDLTLGTLEFLVCSGRLESTRALLVGAFRSEELAAGPLVGLQTLLDEPLVVRLELERLAAPEVASMVSDMLALLPPPEPLTRYLSAQSEGNPFFVAEYLRTALAAGLLDRDETGRWLVEAGTGGGKASDEGLPLPGSVRGLVARRLEGLSEDARRLAEAASVLGREPDLSLLQHVCGMNERVGLEGVQELLVRQVFEEPEPGRLRFGHDKIREVAYEQIDAQRRGGLHRAAAESIEAGLGTGQAPHRAELGLHWERCGEADKACAAYLASARHARDRYAHRDAEGLYRAHLRLLPPQPTPESIAARNELAFDVLRNLGRIPDAMAEHRQALQIAAQLGLISAEGHALRCLGHLHWQTGELREAADCYERALQLARGLGERSQEARVLGDLANLRSNLGQVEQAEALYEQALAIAREMGDHRLEAINLGNLALQHSGLGRLDEARLLYERALALHRESGERRIQAMTLGNLALLHAEQGEFERAGTLLEQALAMHRSVGNRRVEGHTLGNLALLRLEEGRADLARPLLEQALGLAQEFGEPRFAGIWFLARATLERRAGSLAAAERSLEQAERQIHEQGDARQAALCFCERGHQALAAGRTAADFLGRARAIAVRLGAGLSSRLGRAVARLERAVEAGVSERRLVRGECPEDLSGAAARRGQAPRVSSRVSD
jgi:tetratricopeptide (TPR) repeat protein/predicted kinase